MDNKTLAKILAEETLGAGGAIDAARVAAVCDFVETNVPETRKTSVLRLYAKLLRPILSAQTATVETSGKIGDDAYDALKAFVLKQSGRSDIVFQKKENPELLGGVRITCGDNIWERSVKSDLESLAGTANQPIEFKR